MNRMKLHVMLITISIIASSTFAGPTSYYIYDGHSYFLTAPGTWPEAELEAVAAGGHLVTMNDAAENAWVTSVFHPINTPGGPWIGFYQLPGSPEPAGGWVWISDEPVTYINWGATEPSNTGEIEDYAQLGSLTSADTWNDWSHLQWNWNIYGPIPGIAEIPSIIPAPGAILLGSIGVGLVGWLRRRRTI